MVPRFDGLSSVFVTSIGVDKQKYRKLGKITENWHSIGSNDCLFWQDQSSLQSSSNQNDFRDHPENSIRYVQTKCDFVAKLPATDGIEAEYMNCMSGIVLWRVNVSFVMIKSMSNDYRNGDEILLEHQVPYGRNWPPYR